MDCLLLAGISRLEVLTERYFPACLQNAAGSEPQPESFLRVLFDRIGVESRTFLELGHGFIAQSLAASDAWSGHHFSDDELCCRRAERTYQGQPVACRTVAFSPDALRAAIQAARICSLDLLALCVMGDELGLWRNIEELSPRVVCILYNASYLPWQEFQTRRASGAAWLGDRDFSASLKSLHYLAQARGYQLVGCASHGDYAFFVRSDLVSQRFAQPGNVLFHYRCPKYGYWSYGYPRSLNPDSNFQQYLRKTSRPPYLRLGSWDLLIWNSVSDEYAALPESFAGTDVIVDLGAHVGGFSAAASMRGGPTVLAFEANSENFAIARKNLAPFARCEIHHLAVWRSDLRVETLTFAAPSIEANTGGGTVVASSQMSQVESAAYVRNETVRAIALDDILEAHPSIRYLKIDVEGAEYPIFYTSKLLTRVFEIAGEFHEQPEVESASMPALAAHLKSLGFWVIWRDTSPGLGLFFASRDTCVREKNRKTRSFGWVQYRV